MSVGALVVGCGPKNNETDPNNTNGGTNNTNGMPGACDDELVDGFEFFPQSVASGDPTDSTVILWTRVEDEGAGDLAVELQVALDEEFTERFVLDGDACAIDLTAAEAFDHCVKARLTGLEAGTHYYYRFVYEKDGTRYVSKVGRTKTAPAPDADVDVRFAYVSCQDYTGRYFNTYKRLAQEELDLVIHLGDYVYETDIDPSFQMATGDRVMTFRNPDEALSLGEGEFMYRAANSLGNYRDLYRTYRGDPELQNAHERYPFVIIWDDHEFANDSYGATSNDFGDDRDQADVERRKNANQAWFEYMPVDYREDPDFEYDRSAEYPNDLSIYRDIRYGANVHFVMTDLRSYRADHVIPEDLFPGTVLADQATVEAELGEVPDWADPYVDVDAFDGGSYATILTDAGYSADDITGNLSVRFINGEVAALNEELPMDMQITPIDPTGLEAGLTGVALGKTGTSGSLGSRYFVVHEPFLLYSKLRWDETSGASEEVFGAAQEEWFLDTMQNSDAVWKIWGNEYCLTQRNIDLTALSSVVGEAFAQLYQLTAEDWDGMPNKRDEILDALSAVSNVVAITGDIHAFFAGTPFVRSDTSKRIVELVTAAVSSTTFKSILIGTANSDPALREAGAATLAENIENFLFFASKPNPPLAYGDTAVHGFALIEANADTLECTFYAADEETSLEDLSPDAVGYSQKRFTVKAGQPDLFSNLNGAEKRWDPETAGWVDP